MKLPERAHALFDAKGPENAARVRRIVQVVSAIHARPRDWRGLRVLDVGCGEGLFALEAACHGADVVAIDGREQRMGAGRALAAELALKNLRFLQADVRTFEFERHGPFDVVLLLGLLYHLDAPDVFRVVRRIADATLRTLVIETHVARHADEAIEFEGRSYRGWRCREHRATDDAQARDARLLASLDSESSFWLAPESLYTLLGAVGFPTVLQCRSPVQPSEAEDRSLFVAVKGDRPELVSFPWINTAGEGEVRDRSRSPARAAAMPPFDTAAERARTDIVITLGGWARSRREFVFGFREHAALWRRTDLENYTGGLRRVPPLLAVLVGVPQAHAADLVAAGAAAVWLVQPELARVVVVTAEGTQVAGAGDKIPAPVGLPGLAPYAADLLGTS